MPEELPTDPGQIEAIACSLSEFAHAAAKQQHGSQFDLLWMNCPAIPIIHACAREMARHSVDMVTGVLIDADEAEAASHLVPHGYFSDVANLAAAAWRLATDGERDKHANSIGTLLRSIALAKSQYVGGIHRDDVARERQKLIPLAQAGQAARKQRSAAGFSSGDERRASRQPVWDEWQRRADELHQGNPARRKQDVCNQVGREFGVTGRAVAKRVQFSGTERPRS